MNEPTHTRKEAAALGLAKYWTGKPCKAGHEAVRVTATGACTACVRGYHQQYQVARNEAIEARGRGAMPLTVLVHPDDVQAVTELASALTVARSLA